VAYWRERVWRNAEHLVRSTGTPLHDIHVQAIEGEAELWAMLLTTGTQVPGHRERRDAYCEAQAAARADATAVPAVQPVALPAPAEQSTQASAEPLPATGGGAGL